MADIREKIPDMEATQGHNPSDTAANEAGPDVTIDSQTDVEAIATTATSWTKFALLVAYSMLWVISFVDSMEQSTSGILTPWVTSAFRQHSLTPTVNVMSSIVSGVSKITLAKVVDIFGRPQGYLLSVILTTVGLVMMAACNTVETYAAAQVFYWVGFNGMGYCLTVFIADTTTLRNRGLMIAFGTSAHIVTPWLAGPISEAFLSGPGWRWGFGIFSIVTPLITLPLYFLFLRYYREQRSPERSPGAHSDRSLLQVILHYAREFDVVGILLLSGGSALLLLPFCLYSSQTKGWASPIIFSFFVSGVVLLVSFGVWERWLTPVGFMDYSMLKDRTILGSCILGASVATSFHIWEAYFESFLQVVYGLTVTEACYVSEVANVGSCLWCIVVGLLIKSTGRFKWMCVCGGLPSLILGAGLMIYFRQPGVHMGYIVMSQILIALGIGTIRITKETAAMAVTLPQNVALVLATIAFFSQFGSSVGLTVSSAVWRNVFPHGLEKHLPESKLGRLESIYGNLRVQLSYLEGSAARIAIQQAYSEAQRTMLIVSTVALCFGVVGALLWRDIKIKKVKHGEGLVI